VIDRRGMQFESDFFAGMQRGAAKARLWPPCVEAQASRASRRLTSRDFEIVTGGCRQRRLAQDSH
jgi:hypothetical protein